MLNLLERALYEKSTDTALPLAFSDLLFFVVGLILVLDASQVISASEDKSQDLTAGDLSAYKTQVYAKIVRNWVYPKIPHGVEELSAQVKVKINTSGSIISTSLAKGSGNSTFDQSVLKAVERTSSLPVPPPSVQAEALRDGFLITFVANMMSR